MFDLDDVPKRLTVAGAIREGSKYADTIGAAILEHEAGREHVWTYQEWQARLKVLDNSKERARAYLKAEGLGE